MPVRPELVDAVIQHESSGNPGAVSSQGATGLMQIEPSVAKDYGVDPGRLTDPVVNRDLGTRYLGDLINRYRGDERQALIAYNQGPNRQGLAPGVEQYADNVLATANANRPSGESSTPALNPQAETDYAATQDTRAKIFAAQRGIAQVEALAPNEKAQALANNGYDAGGWAQYKIAANYPLSAEDKQALTEARVGGYAPGIDPSDPHAAQNEQQRQAAGSGAIFSLDHAWLNQHLTSIFGIEAPEVAKGLEVAAKVAPWLLMLRGVVPEAGGAASAAEGNTGAAAGADAASGEAAGPAAATTAEQPGSTPGAGPAAGAAQPAASVTASPQEAPGTPPAGTAPAATEAMSTLYRAEPSVAGKAPQWVKDQLKGTPQEAAAGRWFTQDQAALDWYKANIEPERAPRVVSVDVPTKDLEQYRVSNQPDDVKRFSLDPENEFFLPKDVAAGRAAVAEAAAARPFDPHSDMGALQMARQNPMSDEEFNGIKISGSGEHATPAQPLGWQDTYRAAEYGGKFADEALGAQKAFALDGSSENKAALDDAMAKLDEVSEKLKPILHESGLALQKIGASPGASSLRAIWAVQDTNESAPARLAVAMGELPTTGEREKLLADASSMSNDGWTVKGMLLKLFVNNALSLRSVSKKLQSDVGNTIMQVPVRALAAATTGAAHALGSDFFDVPGGSGVGVSAAEAHSMAVSMVETFGRALKTGLDSARVGRPLFGEANVGFFDEAQSSNMGQSLMAGSGYENTWWGRALDYWGHATSVPGRAITGVDQMASAMNSTMELHALAVRQGLVEAAGEGLSGTAAAGRAAELTAGYMEHTPGWMLDQAAASDKITRFQQDLEGISGMLDQVRQKSYIARTMFMFFKTPVNIQLQQIRQSALGLAISPTLRGQIAGGGPESAIALSKMALGSAVMAYFVYHRLQGSITGGVPPNLKGSALEDWMSDNQPYSVKSHDADGNVRWTSYEGMEPYSGMAAMAADAAPIFAYLEAGEADQAVAALAQSAAGDFNRTEIWGGLHQLTTMIDAGQRGRAGSGLTQYGSRMAATLVVPSMVSNFAQYQDPVHRQAATNVLEALRAGIPYLRKNGIPTLDSYGREVYMPPGAVANETNLISTTRKQPDAVVDEDLRLAHSAGYEIPQIPKSIGPQGVGDADPDLAYGAKLTPEEQNHWNVLRSTVTLDDGSGKMVKLYDALGTLQKSAQYLDASDPLRAAERKELVMAYQHTAHDLLLSRDTALSGRLIAAYASRTSQRVAGRSNAGASIGAP